jgi:hypothetical protein
MSLQQRKEYMRSSPFFLMASDMERDGVLVGHKDYSSLLEEMAARAHVKRFRADTWINKVYVAPLASAALLCSHAAATLLLAHLLSSRSAHSSSFARAS